MTTDLLLVAPHDGGHHAEFARWILRAGQERGQTVALAAGPSLLAEASDLPETASATVIFPEARAGGAWSSARSYRHSLKGVVSQVPAGRTLLVYLDAALPALALPGQTPPGLAGLLFRPPFRIADPFSGRVRLAARRALLRHATRGPLQTLLTLDPAVVPLVDRRGTDVHALPDPAEVSTPSRAKHEVRSSYGIAEGRALAVLFGSLEERKGTHALIAALHRMTPAAAQRLAVMVAGRRPAGADGDRLASALKSAEVQTSVQVIFHPGFLPDPDLADLTAAADLILAPYVGHIGSSGVVVRAAAAGVPVVAQAAGQIGREVRAHALGRTVESSDAGALARVLEEALDGHDGFDAQSAAAFAQAHTVSRFVDTLYDALFPSRV